MKYAIYDKAAEGYLTKMEFEQDVPDTELGLRCGYNEYITKAQLLDTKEAADDIVADIEKFKYMEKGRFVIHSFDDTLKDQYIISEAGNPTKVVDNITVDIDGNITVKYGDMLIHWSATSLKYTINRMNRLQETISPKYGSWHATFNIYKVITISDERSCDHYQFINVTAEGLEKYSKNEIEELEKANYENADSDRSGLKNVIDTIDRMAAEEREMIKEIKQLRDTRGSMAEVIFAMRNAMCYNNNAALSCINDRMIHDTVFNSDPFMTGVGENIRDICDACFKNIANYELKNSEITKAADALKKVNDKNEGLTNILKEIIDYVADIMLATRTTDYDKMISDLTDVSLKIGVKTIDDGPMYGISVTLTILIKILRERNSLFALKNNYKRMANSIYGMTIPCRCNGKQMYADITTGKKILIDKEKYDDLMECVNDINLTYEMMKIIPFSTERPTWLPGVINRISNLTK